MDPDDAERHLAPARVDDLLVLGVAEEAADGLRATVHIAPHEPFLVASDLLSRPLGPDHVTGITRPTTLLGHMTVRRPVRRALEVGTGNGILALLAARHAEHVVATDVNEHALELTRLNAALNGVTNVETRLGSFLEPVAGERFGLVFSNPPYVVSPATDYLFRDASMGDELSEHVVRTFPEVLDDGGYLSVTISWVAGDDVTGRPRRWLESTGCDAWLFHTTTDDALATAALWNRDVEHDAARYAERIDRWVAWYAEQRISALAYGVCVLHRRDGANWVRTSNLPLAPIGPASAQLERMFAAPARVGLEDVLVPAPDALLRQTLAYGGGAWSPRAIELALDGGLGFTAGLDAPSAAVVSALDGRPLRDVFAAARAQVDVDAGRFDSEALALVQQLAELGFVAGA